MDISLTTSAAALLGIALEALKKMGLPSRFAPLVNLVLSVLAAIGLAVLAGKEQDLSWMLANAVTIAGTAAVGYDTVKGIRDK